MLVSASSALCLGGSRGNGEGRRWGGLTSRCAPCREAIGLVCEAVPGAKGAVRRRKVRLGWGAAGGEHAWLSGRGAKGRIPAQLALPRLGSLGL